MRTQSTPNIGPEEWRPVVGYKGWYSVSSYGRVRRERSGIHTHAGRILKQFIRGRQYLGVGLTLGTHESLKFHYVHALVCEAWHGPKPDGHGVNHRNGLKWDNIPDNLEWATPKENSEHAVETGLMHSGDRSPRRLHPEAYPVGERHPQSKLTEALVREIRSLPWTQDRIAAHYGVTQRTVSLIRRRLAWQHVN